LVVLGKLAGANQLQEIADWAKAHQAELAQWLALPRKRMPHAVTFSRVLADKVESEQLEKLLREHFKQQVGP